MVGVSAASLISIISMCVLTLVVLWYFILSMFQTNEEWKDENNKWEWLGPTKITDYRNHPCSGLMMTDKTGVYGKATTWFNLEGLLMGIPYFCTAFLCHFNVFSVFSEMKKPTK